jgi:hypothetical protein
MFGADGRVGMANSDGEEDALEFKELPLVPGLVESHTLHLVLSAALMRSQVLHFQPPRVFEGAFIPAAAKSNGLTAEKTDEGGDGINAAPTVMELLPLEAGNDAELEEEDVDGLLSTNTGKSDLGRAETASLDACASASAREEPLASVRRSEIVLVERMAKEVNSSRGMSRARSLANASGVSEVTAVEAEVCAVGR